MAISTGRFRVVEMDKDGFGGDGYTVVYFELYNHKGEAIGSADCVLENEEAEDYFSEYQKAGQ